MKWTKQQKLHFLIKFYIKNIWKETQKEKTLKICWWRFHQNKTLKKWMEKSHTYQSDHAEISLKEEKKENVFEVLISIFWSDLHHCKFQLELKREINSRLPCWFGVLLLLFDCPFEFSQSAKAICCCFLAWLACESKWNLLGCLLWSSKNWLNTALETELLAIITTTAESTVAFFTTRCLCNFACCVLLAELAEELLGLWVMNHRSEKGSTKTVSNRLMIFLYFVNLNIYFYISFDILYNYPKINSKYPNHQLKKSSKISSCRGDDTFDFSQTVRWKAYSLCYRKYSLFQRIESVKQTTELLKLSVKERFQRKI